MHGFFLEITILLVMAAALSIFFRLLKQPPILAYILTGILAAQFLLITPDNQDALKTLSEFGITLLLFILGVELKIGNLRAVGKVAFITGAFQIIFTTIIGFVVCTLLGLDNITALFVAFAITFSSTIVIVKLLSDKKDLSSLYGKILIGILLVQDFTAIMALILLSSMSSGESLSILGIALIFAKAILLIGLIVLTGKYVFPALIHLLSRNQEILFLSSLAWAFGFAAFVASPYIGFSIEIGGFLAGLALANSIESTQIISKVRALRDFFVVIFFVILGSGMNLNNLNAVIVPSIALALFVLIVKPLIVMTILGLQGYSKRTNFMTGVSLAQVSEFSLILLALGSKSGQINQDVVTMVTLTSIITFTFSTYLILNSEKLYQILKPALSIFERKNNKESSIKFEKELENHFILIGGHRMGTNIIDALQGKEELLVIDFNPDLVKKLNDEGVRAIFGDISDSDILEKGNIEKAKTIFSTVPDFQDNLTLCRNVDQLNPEINIIVTAHTDQDKKDLYKAGADYVIMPYNVAAKSIAKILKSGDLDMLK